MSNLDALTDRAAALVSAAKRAGADAADAVVVSGSSLSIGVRDGRLEESERSESDDLGLRVFVGRRTAIVSTSDPDPAGFKAMAERAVAMARVAPEDRFAGLTPSSELARVVPDLDLFDQTELSAAELTEMALKAEAAGLGVAGVTKSSGASASAGTGGFVLVTSEGFSGAYRGSRFGVSMTAIAGDGVGMERDYDYSSEVYARDLSAPELVGRLAGERAVRRLNPQKLATGKLPVVFDRRVATSLVGHLSGAINGVSITRGTSFLKSRLNDQVFAKGIQILDDPLMKRGARSRPFDAEGRATARRAFVEDGVITSWVLDGATARELGLSSTGSADRGVGSAPSPSMSNLTLQPGTLTLEAMLKRIGTGLLVTDLIGSGANLVTGDYSRGCSGYYVENGELAYAVAEITIAGHLGEMFAALEPCADIERKGSVAAPSVYVGELTIAGR
jgi:PmbA protein